MLKQTLLTGTFMTVFLVMVLGILVGLKKLYEVISDNWSDELAFFAVVLVLIWVLAILVSALRAIGEAL